MHCNFEIQVHYTRSPFRWNQAGAELCEWPFHPRELIIWHGPDIDLPRDVVPLLSWTYLRKVIQKPILQPIFSQKENLNRRNKWHSWLSLIRKLKSAKKIIKNAPHSMLHVQFAGVRQALCGTLTHHTRTKFWFTADAGHIVGQGCRPMENTTANEQFCACSPRLLLRTVTATCNISMSSYAKRGRTGSVVLVDGLKWLSRTYRVCGGRWRRPRTGRGRYRP